MKTKYIWLCTGLLLLGCNKFDDDINTDPNNPSVATATQLIANAQLYLPDVSSSPQGEYYAQYLSETQYPNLSLFNTVAFSFYGWYQGPLMNLEKILGNPELANGNDGPVANQLAIAKILKAYYFWHVTDRWGDVPYSEALQGVDNFNPVYDTQREIYASLFALLDEAQAAIVDGAVNNDIIYGGDGQMQRWKRLANTIRLLMALRLSEVDPETAQQEFNEAFSAGIFESNDDNLIFRHLPEAAQQNYWYGQIVNQNRDWWALSETLVDLMKPANDPRLFVYGNPNTKGDYEGLEFGREAGWDGRDPSLLGSQIYEQDAPVYLVTYAQALFALAEAAKRGWIGGGDGAAQEYYERAIEQSLLLWTGEAGGLDDLLEQPTIAYNPTTGIQQIATQRWIHLFMHGFEAWAEWRRTGYPALATSGGKQIPTRQAYTELEKSRNTENYDAAVQRQFGGDDGLYGRVWWDVD